MFNTARPSRTSSVARAGPSGTPRSPTGRRWSCSTCRSWEAGPNVEDWSPGGTRAHVAWYRKHVGGLRG